MKPKTTTIKFKTASAAELLNFFSEMQLQSIALATTPEQKLLVEAQATAIKHFLDRISGMVDQATKEGYMKGLQQVSDSGDYLDTLKASATAFLQGRITRDEMHEISDLLHEARDGETIRNRENTP